MTESVSARYLVRSLLSRPLDKLVYWLAGLVPRAPNLWLVGAQNGRFACNPKYFFLHVHQQQYPIRCVWVSPDSDTLDGLRRQGFEAVHPASVKGIWLALRAKVYLVNCHPQDVGFLLSNGAFFFNLWHGIPLKKIGYDDERRANERPAASGSWKHTVDRVLSPRKAFRFDGVLSTSEFVTEYSFASAFDVQVPACVALGYPRTDILFAEAAALQAHLERHEPSIAALLAEFGKTSRVLLYAPTWRDTDEDFVQAAGLDFSDLNRRLKESDAYLLLKMHPYTVLDFSQLEGLTNIRVLPRELDLYPLMPRVDLLITDYSSIYFDYLLLDRPIVFFCFDLEQYLSDCRSFYLDYEDVTPGARAQNYAELCSALFDSEDDFGPQRAALREKFWGDYAGAASASLVRSLSQKVGLQ